jgi:hypothetical protein
MKKNIQDRDFKGVWIPKDIWLNPELSLIEKCLIAEIDSLDNDEALGCYASNAYLAEFVGVSESRLKGILSNLRKLGFLRQVYFDGRTRGLRVIWPSEVAQQTDQKQAGRRTKNNTPEVSNPAQQTDQKQAGPYIRTINKVTDKVEVSSSNNEKVEVGVSVPDFVRADRENLTAAMEEKKETPQVPAAPPLTWEEIESQLRNSQRIEAAAMNNKISPNYTQECATYFLREQVARGRQYGRMEDALSHFINWLPGHLRRAKDNEPPKGHIAKQQEVNARVYQDIISKLENGTFKTVCDTHIESIYDFQ